MPAVLTHWCGCDDLFVIVSQPSTSITPVLSTQLSPDALLQHMSTLPRQLQVLRTPSGIFRLCFLYWWAPFIIAVAWATLFGRTQEAHCHWPDLILIWHLVWFHLWSLRTWLPRQNHSNKCFFLLLVIFLFLWRKKVSSYRGRLDYSFWGAFSRENLLSPIFRSE